MTNLIRITALVVALGMLAHSPIQADSDTEGDWAGGWNTWKTTKVGDWIETSIEGGVRTHWEVLKVEGGKVTFNQKTYSGDKETSNKDSTKDLASLKVTVKLPYNKKFAWSEETLTLSGLELKCDVASWVNGAVSESVYYCKDVPCGGFVKSTLDGRDIVWLSAFHTEASGDVKADPVDAEPAVKSQLPRFYATAGNSVIIKISGTGRDATWQLRTIGEVTETSTKYTAVNCDEAGTPLEGAKPAEREQTKADWDKVYGKSSESGVKLKVGDVEFNCDVYRASADGKETTEWISEGAPIKKLIKSASTETVMEATKVTMK